jgi:transcriptional regulator with XRE-family HTH domain
MAGRAPDRTLFPALLRYWRCKRGYSQLDLSLVAEVSTRHLSFLETGRAQPSEEMVLRLSAVLDLSMRDKNALLAAAGYLQRFSEPAPKTLAGPAERALEQMLKQHEPFPLIIFDSAYEVVRNNLAAANLMARFIAEPGATSLPLNVFDLLFDPRLSRPFILDWEKLARLMLMRLQRELLQCPNHPRLSALLDRVLGFPDVPEGWQQPDFALGAEAVSCFTLQREDLKLTFLTTITAFAAPQNVTLEELRIESYFPADSQTELLCRELLAG